MRNHFIFTRLTAAEADTLLKRQRVRVLDVRDAHAFAQERMPAAEHFGSAELDAAIRSKVKHKPILVYCYHGKSSQIYAQTLADFGFHEVYDLIGGFEAWRSHLAAKAAKRQPSSALAAWLTQHGFSPDDLAATTQNRHTALMHACRLGQAAIAAELILCGAPLQATNDDGNNALWLACFSGNLELIDLLIANGIDVNHQNDNGASCLMYAASSGKTEVVMRLLVGGASHALKSLDDFTALDMAANIQCLQLLSNAARRTRKEHESA